MIRIVIDVFQSTLPVRGATLEGSGPQAGDVQFQSTLPVRGATTGLKISLRSLRFQSTLPVRGATHSSLYGSGYNHISIHAPREGSDERRCGAMTFRPDFNPRSP